MKRLVIVGAGGFGREALDIVAAVNATARSISPAASRSNTAVLRPCTVRKATDG